MKCLNPGLYNRLANLYGEVRVANLGETATFFNDKINRRQEIVSSGEYYRICCPFCRDSRFRLWINHRFGTLDDFGKRIETLAICYNEECLKNSANRLRFSEQIFNEVFHPSAKNKGLTSFKLTDASIKLTENPIITQEFPGNCILANYLPDTHHMVRYFSKRGVTKEILERFYVSYCVSTNNPEKYKYVVDRAIIPFYRNGKLISWQARVLSELLSGRVPKYYTCPGSTISATFYNFDTVLRKPFCLIVEGVTDAWALPDYSAAAAGKSISERQIKELGKHFVNKPVAIMFDGSAATEITKAVNKIRKKTSVNAFGIFLPDGKDPADMPKEDLKRLVVNQAKDYGILIDL